MRSGGRRPSFAALLAAAALLADPLHAEINLAAYRTLGDCDAALTLYPGEIDVTHCYPNLAERERNWGEVLAHLRDRLERTPGDPRLVYALGLVDVGRGSPEAEGRLREAADRFARAGNEAGEVQSLLSLYYLLQQESNTADADVALSRAEKVAESSGAASLRQFVLFHRGTQALERNDFVEANRCFQAVESEVFPDGHPLLQAFVLQALASKSSFEGRPAEAMDQLRRSAEILHRIGDYAREAQAQYRIASLVENAAGSGHAAQEEVDAALRTAREAAERGRNNQVMLWLLRDRMNEPGLPVAERLKRYRPVLEMARLIRRHDVAAQTLRAMASATMDLDPSARDSAFDLADEAIEVAQAGALTADEAFGYIARALLHRRQAEREAALADWERGLGEIERIRDQQRDDLVQARLTHRFAFTYYRLIGYIMEGTGDGPGQAEIERALRVGERLRARRSLETLDDAAASTPPDGDLQRQRASALDALARLQRGLSQKDLTAAERAGILSSLARLEAEEAALRARIARGDPRFASLRTPEYASVEEIQQALKPDEALLSFHVGPEDKETPWLISITGAGASAYRLPPPSRIEKGITLFLGLLERRDGQEGPAAAALLEMLLRPAVAALGPEIRHLILVPEGPLHRLPIDLLREGASGPLLAERFDFSRAPSASAWRRWRVSPAEPAPLPLLALADPELTAQETSLSHSRGKPDAAGAALGPLPLARRETAAIARMLGGGGRVVEGAGASERFLKDADPHRYQILHIAAHAVLDDEHPQRSAILLAPGSAQEDGLLQIREVVNLDLRDRVVVLSACSSGAGTVLQGAGVMGMARGFFRAGARAVVGSLLPLRDDEAASLMTRMAAHMARGASVAASVGRARRELAAEGAPPAAWAGVIVLGDGDLIPFPGGVARSLDARSLAIAGALAGLLWLAWRSRRRPA